MRSIKLLHAKKLIFANILARWPILRFCAKYGKIVARSHYEFSSVYVSKIRSQKGEQEHFQVLLSASIW